MVKLKKFCARKNKKAGKITILCMVILLAIFCIVTPLSTFSASEPEVEISEDLANTIIEELEEIDFSGLNLIVEEFNNNQTNLFSIENIKSKIYSIISGENAISYKSFIASLFSIIIENVVNYLPLLSLIVAIGVLSNLLSGIKGKFNEKSSGDLIHLVCFLAVVVVSVGMITSLSNIATSSINSMVNQMNVLFPILLTLMTAIGANLTASVYQPIVAIISTYVADFFKFLILPLFTFSFVISILSNMSESIKLDKLNSFISSLFKWCVGIIFTLFFAIFTIQGISAGSFDSLSIRTTKYTIKSYVPLVGGYLSDGMDLILSSTVLIKNATGLVGLLLIISTIISPLLQIAIFSLMLKLVSAILQPMGNSRTSNFLMSTSKCITMLSTCLIVISFMYLLSIGLVMITSNVVVWWADIFYQSWE